MFSSVSCKDLNVYLNCFISIKTYDNENNVFRIYININILKWDTVYLFIYLFVFSQYVNASNYNSMKDVA